MDATDYILTSIFSIMIGGMYVKEIMSYVKNRVQTKEYINIGNSKTDKIWISVISILLILQLIVDKEIQYKIVWIGLSILCIYRDSKSTILLETGIGQKNIFNMKEQLIKWEQIESYKKTFLDEIEIEYKDKNDKIKKYNFHTSTKKIKIIYEYLKKYIGEKEVE